MGTKERKERERGQRRREILAAARDLVLKEGPAAVTMDRVAEAAELAKGTLYLYFASRADLVGSLVVEFSGGLADALEEAAATREDPLEALEAVGRAHWSTCAPGPAWPRCRSWRARRSSARGSPPRWGRPCGSRACGPFASWRTWCGGPRRAVR